MKSTSPVLFLVLALFVRCSPSSVVPVGEPVPPEAGEGTVRVSGVVLDHDVLVLRVGQTEVLGAAVKPSDAANRAVSWSSGDEAVAVVSPDGRVVALAAGVSVVAVKTLDGAFTAECIVTVEASAGGGDPDEGEGGDGGEGGEGGDPDPDPDPDPDDPDDDPDKPEPPAAPASGTIGALRWVFTANGESGGVLAISGDGELPDYDDPADPDASTDDLAPWTAHNPEMAKVIIGEGVTRIGNHCFTEDYALMEVTVMAAVPPALGEGNFPVWSDTLYVPAGSLAAYWGNDAWRDAFNTIID